MASTITLYTAGTPNGVKISVLLEELGLSYKTHKIDLSKNEQKEPWFLKVNPNGRIPAITDKHTDGSDVHVWESGAIMQYLVDRYDTEHKISYPHGSRGQLETTSWLMWQMGGLGPMAGQAAYFKRVGKDEVSYAVDRYVTETRRLLGIMNEQLGKTPYLAGDKATVADFACFGWVAVAHDKLEIKVEDMPQLETWMYRLLDRPAVEKGRHVPVPHHFVRKDEKSKA